MKNFKRMVAIFFSSAMILAFIPSIAFATGHTVTYYKKSGDEVVSVCDKTVEDNAKAVALTPEELARYDLENNTLWSTTAYSNVDPTEYDFDTPVIGDLSLYAYSSITGTAEGVQGFEPGPAPFPSGGGTSDAHVAQIGSEKYKTVQSAINAAEDGVSTSIEMLDIVNEQVTIPANKIINLDLKGKSITYQEGIPVTVYGKLTVSDNGESNGGNTEIGSIDSQNHCGIIVGSGGELIFNSGTVQAQEMAVLFYGPNAKGTINGGSFTARDNAVLGTNGTKGLTGNEITINGGKFDGLIETSGYVACGIYAANNDTWNVNGGSFNIFDGAGIVARAGVVNVGNEVSIQTDGTATGKVGDSRVVVPCSAIVFDAEANYPGLTDKSVINVKGGLFNSEESPTVYEKPVGNKSRISITGGEFNDEPDAGFVNSGYKAVKKIESYEYEGETYNVSSWKVFHVTTVDNTEVTAEQNYTVTFDDDSTIPADIQDDNESYTTVSGVELTTEGANPGIEAVIARANEKASDLEKTALNDASSIHVDVNVTVTPTEYTENNSAAFKLDPKATVTAKNANGEITATIENVAVTNDMLDQSKPITVKIYTGFNPEQIIHIDDNGKVIETFNGDQIAFDSTTGVATVTISHFSSLMANAKAYAARVADTNYETIEEAIAAAKAGENKMITLLADLDLSEYGYEEYHNYDLSGLTLDLDDHTITSKNAGVAWTGTDVVIKNGTFVSLVPSTGEVGGSYAIFVGNDGYDTKDFQLKDLTMTGGVNVYNASGVVLEDLTVNGTNYYAVWAHEDAEVIVKSGTYASASTEAHAVVASDKDNDTSSIKIEGGSFTVEDGQALVLSGNRDVSISGGTFNIPVPAEYCADGFNPVAESDPTTGLYTVEKTKAFAAYDVNGDLTGTYTGLNDAIEAGGNGCTVKLIANAYEQQQINSQMTNVTFDLNGNWINVDGGAGLNFSMGYYWNGDHSFTVRDSVGNGGIKVTPKYTGNACISDNVGRTIIVESGTFTSTGTAIYCTASNGTMTINGGTFNGDVYVHDTGYGHGALSITAGTINGTLSAKDAATIDVSGGTFNQAVPQEYCADGYSPKDNGDGTYSVEVTPVAQVGDIKYTSLAEAIAAADGKTVKMLENVKLLVGVDVSGNVTLDLNGKTISDASGITSDYLLAVLHGGTLKVKDTASGGKISMSTHYCAIKMTKANDGNATLNATLIVDSGTIEGYDFAISGNGNSGRGNSVITINGGVIRNTKTEGNGDDAAIYQPNTGTVTLNGGTITGLTGVEVRAGNLVIPASSTIVVEGTGNPPASSGNGNGTTTFGAGIAVAQHTTDHAINVTIAGGSVSGAYALAFVNPNERTGNNVSVAVSGGTFIGTGSNAAALMVDDTRVTKFVSGGSFSSAVSKGYCAEGFEPVNVPDDDGLFTVQVSDSGATATYSATLTLADNINVNFYLKGIESLDEAKKYTVYYNFKGTDYSHTLTEGDLYKEPDIYRIQLAEVYSYEMGRPIVISVKYDGVEVKHATYSVSTYFHNMINKLKDSEDEDKILFVDLCKSGLDYGASSQIYFDNRQYTGGTYHTDSENLVNADTNPNNKIDATLPGDKYIAWKEANIDGISKYSATLIFGSETSLKVYLTGEAQGVTVESVVDDTGKEYWKDKATDIQQDGSRYSFKINGIKSYQLKRIFTITLKKGQQVTTIKYSPYTYARNMWENKEIGPLAKALVAYGDKASHNWPNPQD